MFDSLPYGMPPGGAGQTQGEGARCGVWGKGGRVTIGLFRTERAGATAKRDPGQSVVPLARRPQRGCRPARATNPCLFSFPVPHIWPITRNPSTQAAVLRQERGRHTCRPNIPLPAGKPTQDERRLRLNDCIVGAAPKRFEQQRRLFGVVGAKKERSARVAFTCKNRLWRCLACGDLALGRMAPSKHEGQWRRGGAAEEGWGGELGVRTAAG